jgi:uncharacterized RDD family membrane protein YckC
MTDVTLPAPPWRRLAAACYDGLLLFAVWMVTLLFSLMVRELFGLARNDHVNALCLFLAGLAFFGWSWTHGGQTLGMRSWRLRLRREDGSALRWPVAALRYTAMLLGWSLALTPLLLLMLPAKIEVPHRAGVLAGTALLTALSLLSILLDPQRRAFYDRLASTEVVLLREA